MLQIFAHAAEIKHVPPVMYEFTVGRIASGGKHGGEEERENVYARVANMPALINLNS